MGDDDGEEGELPPEPSAGGVPGNPPDPPPATPPASGAYGALLAGWAGGGGRSVPLPTRSSALGGYGAVATSSRRAADTTPNTTGKDGRDRSKRQRTAGATTWRAGATSTSAAQTSANQRPCLFWRQGLCKNGDECGYVHGDSLVPCTQFASPGGCRFGDKCAFRHVPVPGSNPAPARTPPPAFLPPPPNPFATHASNCGCRLCHPSEPVRGGDDDEDGELVDAEHARGEGEPSMGEEDTRERDDVLTRCAVIESPEMRRTWGRFAEGAARRAAMGGRHPTAPWNRR
jgi:hypothetical protein